MPHPSILRNREPILAVLGPLLTPLASGADLLLEVASGTGDHAAWLAPYFPHLRWQPSDLDPTRFAPEAPLPDTVLPPIALDAARPPAQWPLPPETRLRALLCINMVHISPWAATLGLLRGARTYLDPQGGVLCLYGPYLRGAESTPGNLAFDADLRARNPAWGVRELSAVVSAAEAAGLVLRSCTEMPANNLTLAFTCGS